MDKTVLVPQAEITRFIASRFLSLDGMPLKALCQQQRFRCNYILWLYDYIEIPELAQFDITMRQNSKRRSLVWNRADIRGFKFAKYPDHFRGVLPVAFGIDLVVGFELFEYRGWDQIGTVLA